MTFRVVPVSRSTTPLSWFKARISGRCDGFWALARLSLGALLLTMLSGCLVDDPPPFIAPQQTPPRLDYTKASPGLDQILVASYPDLITFEVPVTSEDAGDELSAALFLDFDGVDGLPISPGGHLPPSTLADTSPRVLRLKWKVLKLIEPGCHRITLRVTHVGNIGVTNADVLDKADLAEAYWFANINVTPDNVGSLVNCPQASTGGDSP
jgi:hypothetical protein